MVMSRLTVLVMGLGVAAVSACGSDKIVPPPPPPSAPTMRIVAGNNQSANVRNALPVPLTVAMETPDGKPVIGAAVNWTVSAGGGYLSESSTLTDADGQASVVWSFGYTPGTLSVAAASPKVDGSTDFSAHATAPIVLHYDGTAWSTALEDVNGAFVSLASIWGPGSSAVIAVGKNCAGNLVVLQYDGSQWGPLPPSCQGGSVGQFTSVWGSSASDLFITARNGIPPHLGGTVLHSDGQTSTTVFSPPCNTGILCPSPQAVWTRSPADVFSVGDGGMIVHYDGISWSPLQSGTTQALAAVWGEASGNAVFAVGAGGTILNYDGSTWRAQMSGTTQPLRSVWGTSANNVFAVGDAGTILHYDGTTWTAQSSGSTQALYSVSGSSGNSIFAVGDASTILRYDGTMWTALTAAADMNLRGVWASSPTNVFAVGSPR
jgi:hypothetical protein